MFHIIKDERLVSKMDGKTIFFQATETVWSHKPPTPIFYDRSRPLALSP